MLIRKKEYQKLKDRIGDLEYKAAVLEAKQCNHETQIDALLSCHRATVLHKCKDSIMCDDGYYYFDRITDMYTGHWDIIATNNTSVPNLTFDELAKYIIDGTPITRKETVDKVVCPKEETCDKKAEVE